MSLKTKKTHLNKIKVRYSEVDCQRIVYNSHYLTYFDISLSEMLEDCFDQDEYIKNTNNDFHTVGVQMDFKSPARLNDQLEVYTGVKKLGNSSMKFMQEIYKAGKVKKLITIKFNEYVPMTEIMLIKFKFSEKL